MENIKSVKIGHNTYKVKYKSNLKLDKNKVDGYYDPNKYTIFIEKNNTKKFNKATIMHEVVHGLLHSIGEIELYSNEILVEGLAQQLQGLIKEKKQLMKIMMKDGLEWEVELTEEQ